MSWDIQMNPKNAVSTANAPQRGISGSTPIPDVGVHPNGSTSAPTRFGPPVVMTPGGTYGSSTLHSKAEHGQPHRCTSSSSPARRGIAASTSGSQYRVTNPPGA
jgi:hypothetical protein